MSAKSLRDEHLLRMETIIARLRIAVVLVAGAEGLRTPATVHGGPFLPFVWLLALLYAVLVAVGEPYRHLPMIAWSVTSGFLDWGLITIGIVATGGEHSDLYLLYFLSVLSLAMRFSLREVVFAGLGTTVGYLIIVLANTTHWLGAVQDVGLRMGYLMVFAVGSGALARERSRQFHGRMTEESRRLAMQEVTATVSHDLKNPLAAVAGMVEMLLDSAQENLSLDQRALLHRINANTLQMSDLISNLLDAELIERGQLPFRPAPVDLNTLVRRVIEAQAHQAEQKQIGLVLDLSRELPRVSVDGRMIERLVANLLGNAVKFTPEGGAIRVSTHPNGQRVAIEVWDSGPKVPASLRSVLFDKFARQQDSPGIGLGLYICKSIVERHGGTIFVRDGDEGGVAFVAELPVTRLTSAEAQREHARVRLAEKQAWALRRRVV